MTINDGEYVVVLGPSGAGKTSLLKVISGLYSPAAGKILIDEVEVNNLPPESRKIAFLPQDYSLFPKMTVWDHVTFSPKLQKFQKARTEELAREILGMVHLLDRADAFPHELSGGMKQRAALARAIATNFNILLLDEPLRALDARLRLEIRLELKRMAKNLGFTVLHVTHDQEEAMSVADRIVVLNKGQIVQDGTQEDIYLRPHNIFVSGFLGEINQRSVLVQDVEKSDIFVVKDRCGSIFKAKGQKRYEIGQEVQLVVKSESIKLGKSEREGLGVEPRTESDFDPEEFDQSNFSNVFVGEIIEKHYLGKWTNLIVKTNSNTGRQDDWIVKVVSRKAAGLDLGQHLSFIFETDLALIF